jgi:hypothetical protein
MSISPMKLTFYHNPNRPFSRNKYKCTLQEHPEINIFGKVTRATSNFSKVRYIIKPPLAEFYNREQHTSSD